ncbi:MAG TPA: VWA domain-containing protein [Acidobacteriota bacterium]|nr:VWA domain-containing protein [Acidobacteriota bacterium]
MRNLCGKCLLVTALLLILLLLPWKSHAQTPKPRTIFKVSAEEVVMHVRFTDRVGKSISDIRPEEVKVFDDRVEQKVQRVFTSQEPFDIALLLDSSPSTVDNLEQIRYQSAQLVRQLSEQNRLLLLTFDDNVYIDSDWTSSPDKVEEAVWQMRTNQKANHTVLYEAVALAAQKKFTRDAPRKAMIVYTDGVDEGSHGISERDSVKIIEESGIIAYCIQYDSRDYYRHLSNPMPRSPTDPNWEPPVGSTGTKVGPIFVGRNSSARDRAEYVAQTKYDHAKKYLMNLTQAGGGQYFEMLQVRDLSTAYAKIIDELSQFSTVTYIPARKQKDGQFHRVKIATTREGVAVQMTRQGYWAK